MNSQDLIQALQWRYAVKQFDANQKISESDWKALEQSLLLAPSSYGLQPWKFIVVQNQELRAKLRPASWNQSQVTDCSHYVVLTIKPSLSAEYIQNFINRTAEVRGTDPQSMNAYRDMMISDVVNGPRSQIAESWAQRQAYIAMGFLMEAAAVLKIDSCPLEGLDPAAYDDILGLKNSGYKTVAAVALGFRSANDKYQHAKKVRFPLDQIIEVKK